MNLNTADRICIGVHSVEFAPEWITLHVGSECIFAAKRDIAVFRTHFYCPTLRNIPVCDFASWRWTSYWYTFSTDKRVALYLGTNEVANPRRFRAAFKLWLSQSMMFPWRPGYLMIPFFLYSDFLCPFSRLLNHHCSQCFVSRLAM